MSHQKNSSPRPGDWWALKVLGIESSAFKVEDVRGNLVLFSGGSTGKASVMVERSDLWKLVKRPA